MKAFTVESGISADNFTGFGIRRIWMKGFKSSFILSRMFIEDTRYYKYVVMEETTGTILASARSIHSTLIALNEFLRDKEQCDLELFINRDYL